jgi:GH15 family glucan-1,4-alpha-glucosidase
MSSLPRRIEDYALIGDCETAALVGRNGSIDWLCWPRFDSDACFAALLGGPKNGRWLTAPADDVTGVRRRYWPGTLILETEFETDEGSVAIVDFMPIRDVVSDIVRIVIGRGGQVRMRSELALRFDYGRLVPWIERIDGSAFRASAGPHSAVLRVRAPVAMRDGDLVAEFTVRAGERIPFLLTYQASHLPVSDPIDPEISLQATDHWWQDWSGQCSYDGMWPAEVLRSLITIKAMTYRPTGGTVAAPTTSLPERPGGTRNWDYRYCWLRDATFMIACLLKAGYQEEASGWRDWLLRAVAGMPSQLQPVYGIAGEHRLDEWEVDWLPGFLGARPVRIGNAAAHQFQLDIIGEVMNAMHVARNSHLPAKAAGWELQKAFLEHLAAVWTSPDEGLWETRSGRQHFTQSKVMAWVAVDRCINAVEQFGLKGPVQAWKSLREAIHAEVCAKGFDTARGSFVQAFGSKHLDASLLLIPIVGFLPAEDPRMRGTVAAIERELMQDGFVLRYDSEKTQDGLPPGEGVFLVCSFWLAENYALQRRFEEAEALFRRLLSIRNDVGLLSEEYDPREKCLLGNFPQALSHLALVNAAYHLSAAPGAKRGSINPDLNKDHPLPP